MEFSFLFKLIDAGKVAGWTRAVVGAIMAAEIARWPWLSQYLDPTVQAAIATAVSGVVVGVWSHVAKSMAQAPAPAVASTQQEGGR